MFMRNSAVREMKMERERRGDAGGKRVSPEIRAREGWKTKEVGRKRRKIRRHRMEETMREEGRREEKNRRK